MKQMIWITFDLGIRGDYEGMYAFLDDRSAKECGDNAAAMLLEYAGDPVDYLRAKVKEHIELDKRSRIYAVFSNLDGKTVGKFIVGKRKGAPWKGFGVSVSDEEDVSG